MIKKANKAAGNDSREPVSLLSNTLQNLDPNDFYLRPTEKSDQSHVKTRVFFFNSPNFIDIEISQNDMTKDVIRHLMTLYRKSPF